MPRRCAAILNPGADSRAAGVLPRLREAFPEIDVRRTQAPGHAVELARDLAAGGFDCIFALGGDGTIHEIANGLIEAGPDHAAALAVLPLGTGGDFRRSFGIQTVGDALAAVARGEPKLIDAGRLTFRDGPHAARNRAFVNVVSFGMGAAVAARAKNPLGVLGGRTAFLYATLTEFLAFRAPRVELALDGMPAVSHSILNVAVGNGRYHGGGMHVCPRAAPDDGLLDVTVIGSMTAIALARNLGALYSDDIYRCRHTIHHRARRIEAASAERVAIEADGEPAGFLPVTIEVIPSALRVYA